MVNASLETTVTAARAGKLGFGDILLACAPYLSIAHQLPGRVRFKIDAAVLKLPLWKESALDFDPAAIDLPGVRGLKVNKLARSCTVEYDPAVIADAAWVDLLAGRQTPASRDLQQRLAQRYAEVCDAQS